MKGLKITGKIYGSIESSAFIDAPISGGITIGSTTSALTIGASAFYGSTVTSVDMSEANITTMSNASVFYNCRKLSQVLLSPKLITLNGNAMFSRCINLTNLIIPDTVSTFSSNVFYGSYIENLTIGKALTAIPALSGYLPKLKSVTLNDSALSLIAGTFSGCYNLTSITLPENITIIPASCFYMSGIKTVNSLGTITEIGASAFRFCSDLTTLDISNLVTCGVTAFSNSGLTDVVIPKTLTTYATTSFQGIQGTITFEEGFTPNADINLAYSDINDDTVLPLLFSLPDLSSGTSYTLTISPTMHSAVTSSTYSYYTGIKNRTISVSDTGLAWDDTATTTIADYVASKNWTIV